MTGEPSLTNSGLGSLLDDLVERVTARLQAGEPIDIEAIARDFPDNVDRVRKLLPTLEAIVAMGPSLLMDDAAIGRSVGREIGEYRIIREIGRGGMGIVYAAEQSSLGRRVALKVLPFAAVLDQRQLLRFRNEVLAAAQLDHPNIVDVYAVGCERGVHYYAMRFVDGQSLAEVIRGLSSATADDLGTVARRSTSPPGDADPAVSIAAETRPIAQWSTMRTTRPTEYFRMVAQMGMQAADALEHAHQAGVIHRDIKPANLIVDVNGRLWITDFGLARIGADPGMTMTGDVLGTLRYMSPEQSLGKPGLIDHRIDVYSLGVTLYELLSLRPAIAGAGREEVLGNLSTVEPPMLRQLEPAIPADLETIVHKAMAKDPADRYASARELAEDFGRFLTEEPIHARRPSAVHRAVKWTRRHRTASLWALAISLLTTLGTATSAVLIWRAQQDSERALGDARAQQRRAQTALEEANLERERGDANFRLARQAVDQMLTRVADDLATVPQTEQVRRKLLEDALKFYEEFLKAQGTAPAVRFDAAETELRVATIHEILGRRDDAQTALRLAIGLLESLVAEFPWRPRFRQALADAHGALALSFFWQSRYDESLEHRDKEHALRVALVKDFPERMDVLCQLASCKTDIGNLQMTAFAAADAERSHRDAVGIWQDLRRRFPERFESPGTDSAGATSDFVSGPHGSELKDWRRGLAHSLLWQGVQLLRSAGRQTEARGPIENALALHSTLAAESPNDPEVLGILAHNKSYMALVLEQLRNHDEAVREIREVVAMRESLAKRFPALLENKRRLAIDLHDLAYRLSFLGESIEAAEYLERADAQFSELKASFGDGSLRDPTASVIYRLAVADALRYDGHAERAKPLYREALAVAVRAVQAKPGEEACWRVLAHARYRLGDMDGAHEACDACLRLHNDFYANLIQALIRSRRGDVAAARRQFNQTNLWINENVTTINHYDLLGLRRLQAEVADALATPETKGGTQPSGKSVRAP